MSFSNEDGKTYDELHSDEFSCDPFIPYSATAIAEGQWVKGEVEGRGTLTYGVNLSWNLQPWNHGIGHR